MSQFESLASLKKNESLAGVLLESLLPPPPAALPALTRENWNSAIFGGGLRWFAIP
jgi:hypothetical protein